MSTSNIYFSIDGEGKYIANINEIEVDGKINAIDVSKKPHEIIKVKKDLLSPWIPPYGVFQL